MEMTAIGVPSLLFSTLFPCAAGHRGTAAQATAGKRCVIGLIIPFCFPKSKEKIHFLYRKPPGIPGIRMNINNDMLNLLLYNPVTRQ